MIFEGFILLYPTDPIIQSRSTMDTSGSHLSRVQIPGMNEKFDKHLGLPASWSNAEISDIPPFDRQT
jgi:hypothetical protein